MVSSGIRRLVLNGKHVATADFRPAVRALSDPGILTTKAGFLLRATISDACLFLALAPGYVNGVRARHCDMHLPEENEMTLMGSVDPHGGFLLLFRPRTLPVQAHVIRRYAETMILFSRFLLEQGYQGPGVLDWATVACIEEAGVFPTPPATLLDLAAHSHPQDAAQGPLPDQAEDR